MSFAWRMALVSFFWLPSMSKGFAWPGQLHTEPSWGDCEDTWRCSSVSPPQEEDQGECASSGNQRATASSMTWLGDVGFFGFDDGEDEGTVSQDAAERIRDLLPIEAMAKEFLPGSNSKVLGKAFQRIRGDPKAHNGAFGLPCLLNPSLCADVFLEVNEEIAPPLPFFVDSSYR